MSFSLAQIPGLGAKSIADLNRLRIMTPQDLLMHYPMRYDDFSNRLPIADLVIGQTATIQGVVTKINSRRARNRRMTIIEAQITDDSGTLKVIWFNQKYLVNTLSPGTQVRLSGELQKTKYGLQFSNPVYELVSRSKGTHTGRIVPIYPLTGSLTQKRIRTAVRYALERVQVIDWMPQDVLNEEAVVSLPDALREIHFPVSIDWRNAALYRLRFDEVFLYELVHLMSRDELKHSIAPKILVNLKQLKDFVKNLPFELTGAQRKAAWQIVKDMEKGVPMNRMLEGDVGSGKTVVASLVALNAADSGFQTAMLAPTEILAEQHAKILKKFLGNSLTVGLVTRTHGKDLLEDISVGDIDVIVGTHALLEDKIQFHKLGLVVVDEQHRFGVKQRQKLREKQSKDAGMPHLLSMTATPIPRTLALTLYGDLDVSVLDELPPGRRAIKTSIIKIGTEDKVFQFIRGLLDKEQQAFVVAPLIDPSDALGAGSVTELKAELEKSYLKGYKLELLHGRMKAQEKEAVMAKFKKGMFDVLVSTTVVEVGVDVPNATVMYIHGAERFGLAQLHQLRGRVGRSDLPSFCFLHPSGFVPEKTYERLLALVKSNNGFELAEKDLQLRGAGDIYGTQQSGYPAFKLADIFDTKLIARVRNAARCLLDQDPGLGSYPELKQKLEEYTRRIHFE